MARPATHDPEAILDAARTLVLDGGPRAASVAAIATASGAPVGTLYHRFGTRDGLLAAMWLRAATRFRDGYLAAGAEGEAEADAADGDPVHAAAAMAASVVAFARAYPPDAQLLLRTTLVDLLDAAPSSETLSRLATLNAPLDTTFRTLARRCFGRATAPHVDRIRLAVVDLPSGALRRWARDAKTPPRWAETEVAAAAAAILRAGG